MANDNGSRPSFSLQITLLLVVLAGIFAGWIAVAALITGRLEMPIKSGGVVVIYYASRPVAFIAGVLFCVFGAVAAGYALVNHLRRLG